VVHVVKPGESLYGISLMYGVSPHEIGYANNLAYPDLIYAGQTLCIP
jgi:LysM repeat protein